MRTDTECCCCSASPQQQQKGNFHLWASERSQRFCPTMQGCKRLTAHPKATAPPRPRGTRRAPTHLQGPSSICSSRPHTHQLAAGGSPPPRGPSAPSPPEAERPRSKQSVKHGCVYWLALSYSLPAPPAHTEFLLCVCGGGGDLFSIMILFCPRPPRHTHRDAGSAELLCTAQLDRANTQLTP